MKKSYSALHNTFLQLGDFLSNCCWTKDCICQGNCMYGLATALMLVLVMCYDILLAAEERDHNTPIDNKKCNSCSHLSLTVTAAHCLLIRCRYVVRVYAL